MQVSVGQKAEKLWLSSFEDDLIIPNSNPGHTHAMHCGPSGRFFQITNFLIDSLQVYTPLTYRDLQYLFGKIYNS